MQITEEGASAANHPEVEPTLPPDERGDNKPDEPKGFEFKFIPMDNDPRVFPNFRSKETSVKFF